MDFSFLKKIRGNFIPIIIVLLIGIATAWLISIFTSGQVAVDTSQSSAANHLTSETFKCAPDRPVVRPGDPVTFSVVIGGEPGSNYVWTSEYQPGAALTGFVRAPSWITSFSMTGEFWVTAWVKPVDQSAVCPEDATPKYPQCGVSCCSPAYDLRFGHADLDPISGLLYNWKGQDYTKFSWSTAPAATDVDAWCSGEYESSFVTPPPQPPALPAKVRCFSSRSAGGVDWSGLTTANKIGGAGLTSCGVRVSADAPAYTGNAVLCPAESSPVCGRDGKAYSSRCVAEQQNHIPVAHTGYCTSADVEVTATPLSCTPSTQTIQVGQRAVAQASGGNGTYQWDITGGGIQEEGGASTIEVSYATPGSKVLRVNSGNQNAVCAITVIGSGGASTGQAVLSMTKYGRNVDGAGDERTALAVASGQTIDFIVRITNIGGGSTSGLAVKDVLPLGMSYVEGSTRVEGQPIALNTIATSGLVLDRLDPANTVTIQWSAIADKTSQIVGAAPQQSQPRATATADDVQVVTAGVDVAVYGLGVTPTEITTPTSAGGVPTGPGDAVTIALLVAAGLTLLYSGYTRTLAYRRHEADSISHDQGPMDFRS